jgi:hypothetical protein
MPHVLTLVTTEAPCGVEPKEASTSNEEEPSPKSKLGKVVSKSGFL